MSSSEQLSMTDLFLHTAGMSVQEKVDFATDLRVKE
jgi:hypothetical protein